MSNLKVGYAKTTSLSAVVFCHLFYEISGTSACNSVGLPLSKPRAPSCWLNLYFCFIFLKLLSAKKPKITTSIPRTTSLHGEGQIAETAAKAPKTMVKICQTIFTSFLTSMLDPSLYRPLGEQEFLFYHKASFLWQPPTLLWQLHV